MRVGCSASEVAQVSHADCRFGGRIIASRPRMPHRGGEDSVADAWLRWTIVRLHEVYLPSRRNLRALSGISADDMARHSAILHLHTSLQLDIRDGQPSRCGEGD